MKKKNLKKRNFQKNQQFKQEKKIKTKESKKEPNEKYEKTERIKTTQRSIEFLLDPQSFISTATGEDLPSPINWDDVKNDGWQGIEIIPFLQKYRSTLPFFDWYNSWDCSSGTIWNIENIEFNDEVIYSPNDKSSKDLIQEVLSSVKEDEEEEFEEEE